MTEGTALQAAEIVTRTEAKASGLRHYFTGEPCKRGHTSKRCVSDYSCTACSAEDSREGRGKYTRKDEVGTSRQDGKNRCLTYYVDGGVCKNGHAGKRYTWSGSCYSCKVESVNRFKKEHPEQTKATNARWYLENKERSNANGAQWYAKNKEKRCAKSAEWHAANKESVSKRHAKNHQLRPEVKKAAKARRRAREKTAPGSHSAADIRALYKLQKGKCAYCDTSLKGGYRVDHIIPLFLGGSNDRSNLQLTCDEHNLKKSYLHPIDFARRLGLLV